DTLSILRRPVYPRGSPGGSTPIPIDRDSERQGFSMKTKIYSFAAGLIGFTLAAGGALGAPAASIAAPGAAANETAVPALWNPALPASERVHALISKMTLEEKASQLGNAAPAIPRLGVPEYNWWNEGLHGVARAGIATVFPQAIGMAATWDTRQMHRTADVISTEFRAKYVATLHPDGGSDWYQGLTIWSPNINIFRDPRWGRGQETYGEDPFLTAHMAVAFIT